MKKLLAYLSVILLLAACNSEQKKSSSEEAAAAPDMSQMITVTFAVEGMTCEGCENAIAKGVSSLQGIGEVVSSHSEGWTKVVYDPATTNEDAIKEKITEVGYVVLGVKEVEPEAAAEPEGETKTE